MIKKSIDSLNILDRELIVEQTLRNYFLGESCIFSYNGYQFYYDIKTDFIVLKKINKKLIRKKLILPSFFEAIGTGALYNIKNLVSLDAKYIKRIYSNGIKGCGNLKWLDLSSCKYFEEESISGSKNLCKIVFNDTIDYLGKSFIDGQNCNYYFGDVNKLDIYCFEEIENLRLVGNNFNSLFYTNECNLKINHFDLIIPKFKYYIQLDNKRVLSYGGTLMELQQKIKIYNAVFDLRDLRFSEIIASDGVFRYKRK